MRESVDELYEMIQEAYSAYVMLAYCEMGIQESLTGRRFKDANFAFFDTVVQSSHELELNIIRLVWMIELCMAIRVRHCGVDVGAINARCEDGSVCSSLAWVYTTEQQPRATHEHNVRKI